MKTKLSIKNFRVFDDKGAEFEIAPITILTGTNSAGKSSLAKALLCVREVLQCMDVTSTSVDMIEQNIDFQANGKSLGKFKDVVCSHSNEKEKISFSYTMDILNETYTIECTLIQKKEDKQFLDRGWIDSIKILDSDKNVCFSIDYAGEGIMNYFSSNLYSNYLTVLKLMELEYKEKKYLETQMPPFDYHDENHDEKHAEAESQLREYKKELEKEDLLKYVAKRDKIFGHSIWYPHLELKEIRREHNNAFDVWSEVSDFSEIKLFLDNNKMFYLPIFDEIKDKSKYDTIFFLEKRINELEINKDHKYFKKFMEKILQVFETSEYESLIDFYYSYFDDSFGTTTKKIVNTMGRQELLWQDSIPNTFSLNNAESLKESKWDKDGNLSYYSDNVFFAGKSGADCVLLHNTLAKCSYEKVQPESIYSFALYRMFIEKVVQICLRPIFMDNIHYLGTDKINVLRSYSLDTPQKQFASILRKYNDNMISHHKEDKTENDAYEHGKFLHKWLRKLGIARTLMLKVNSETSDISVFLGKLDSRKLRNLADEGCGITQIVALLIQIENTIADCVISKGEMEPTLIVEEPEIHIHPKYQSLLADMFLEAYKTYGIHFIVETHSEYLIRKFQVLTAMKEVSSEDLSVYYLYDANPHKRPKNEKQVKKIEFQENGYLKEPFGLGFFDESRSLVFELLKLSQISKN